MFVLEILLFSASSAKFEDGTYKYREALSVEHEVTITRCLFCQITTKGDDGGAILACGRYIKFTINGTSAYNVNTDKNGGFMLLNTDYANINAVCTKICRAGLSGGGFVIFGSAFIQDVTALNSYALSDIFFLEVNEKSSLSGFNISNCKTASSALEIQANGVDNLKIFNIIVIEHTVDGDEATFIIEDNRIDSSMASLFQGVFENVTVKETDMPLIRNFFYLIVDNIFVGNMDYPTVFGDENPVSIAGGCYCTKDVKVFEDGKYKPFYAETVPFNLTGLGPVECRS